MWRRQNGKTSQKLSAPTCYPYSWVGIRVGCIHQPTYIKIPAVTNGWAMCSRLLKVTHRLRTAYWQTGTQGSTRMPNCTCCQQPDNPINHNHRDCTPCRQDGDIYGHDYNPAATRLRRLLKRSYHAIRAEGLPCPFCDEWSHESDCELAAEIALLTSDDSEGR